MRVALDEEQEDEPVKASTKAQKRRVRKQGEVTRNKESTKAVCGEEKAASDLVTKPIAKKRRTTKARPASGSGESLLFLISFVFIIGFCHVGCE